MLYGLRKIMEAAQHRLREVKAFYSEMSRQTGKDYSSRSLEWIGLLESGVPLQMSLEELTWFGRLAWRNSERCIGRLPWKSLKCFDAQSVTRPREVFLQCLEHIEYSTNKGRIIPAMTFFPSAGSQHTFRLINDQLLRYAGYRQSDGRVIGDPQQVAFTELAIKLGWRPPSPISAFDLLPLIIELPSGERRWYEIPPSMVLEVPIIHPEYGWMEELGLKWHALPAVSNRSCLGLGIRYDCAPFSGYYMGTEIASRNFGDEQRYNMLPEVARRMGLNTQDKFGLWKDRALVELNTAVLYSYQLAGVTIVDHHTASAQFMNHKKREDEQGRPVPGDWSWIVPPMSSSACPVFHHYYSDQRPEPRFV